METTIMEKQMERRMEHEIQVRVLSKPQVFGEPDIVSLVGFHIRS